MFVVIKNNVKIILDIYENRIFRTVNLYSDNFDAHYTKLPSLIFHREYYYKYYYKIKTEIDLDSSVHDKLSNVIKI